MNILPPIPTEPAKREAFMKTWKNEVQVYRKTPSFILGMAMAVISALTLIMMHINLVHSLVILTGIFGVCFVYDTVTRHFCNVLIERNLAASAEGDVVEKQS